MIFNFLVLVRAHLIKQDTNNENLEKMVKQYSVMFDLCAPMKGCVPQDRHLFLEGDLKYKDNVSKVWLKKQCRIYSSTRT